MEQARKPGPAPALTQAEALARLLRHEVGDLLQTVYASVALLKERLPAEYEMEQRILKDLRTRGEMCKRHLDNIHDLVCPVSLTLEAVDLHELTTSLAAAASRQYPQVKVQAEIDGPLALVADPRRLAQLGQTLLATACESAQNQVICRVTPGPGPRETTWTVTDDGRGVPAEQTSQLFSPLSTTRHGHLGVGLALVDKLVRLHGGRVTADNVPGGGFRVTVILPHEPPRNER